MRTILTKNNDKILLDDEWYDLLKQDSWSVSGHGYAQAYINGRFCYMHRLIMTPPKDKHIDHINGNKIDNRVENLRICSRSENLQNRIKPNKNNRHGFVGIYCEKKCLKPWTASMSIDGKQIIIGRYSTKAEAALARISKEMEVNGRVCQANKLDPFKFIKLHSN